MAVCLIIQPIHRRGLDLLENAGIEVRHATSESMDRVQAEIETVDAAITRNAGLSRDAMAAGRNLRVVGIHGIGMNAVAVDYATRAGIPVVFTPYANITSVAEHAIGQMFALSKRFLEADRAVRAGDFNYRYSNDFRELTGKTLLVVGFGRIGQLTARMARLGLGMRVLVSSRSADPDDVRDAGCEPVASLADGLGEADVVSLHLLLTERTRNVIGAEQLAAMKPGAFLVNTARGGLIDEAALAGALTRGHLGGAALDVFETEPVQPSNPLLDAPRLLCTPHSAGATVECLERAASEVARQVAAVLDNRRPEFLANEEVWERRRPSRQGSTRT